MRNQLFRIEGKTTRGVIFESKLIIDHPFDKKKKEERGDS